MPYYVLYPDQAESKRGPYKSKVAAQLEAKRAREAGIKARAVKRKRRPGRRVRLRRGWRRAVREIYRGGPRIKRMTA